MRRQKRESVMRPKVLISPFGVSEGSRDYYIFAATYDPDREVVDLCGPGRFLQVALDVAADMYVVVSADFVEGWDGGRVARGIQHFHVRVSGVGFRSWVGWLRRLRRTCAVRFVRRLGRLCG